MAVEQIFMENNSAGKLSMFGGGLLEGTASLWSGLAALNVHFADKL